MDYELERQHLTLAEEHVWKAKRIIERQLDLIEDLQSHGLETSSALLQLQVFEDVLSTMLQHKKIIEQRTSTSNK